jgi:predicted MFS family arabinose efflux permease
MSETTVRPATVTAGSLSRNTLLTLAIAVFATVTVEMIPAGLLPAMSRDFDVSTAQIGLLVSLWAATIIVASIPLTRLTSRIDRRTVLAGTLVVMAAANVATALAPGYEAALAARIVAAMAHGLFWSTVMVYATSLVDASRSGRTVALVSAGASGATVLGIPLGTLVGQVADWRFVFAGLSVVLLAIATVIVRAAPSAGGTAASRRVARNCRVPRRADGTLRSVLAGALACTFTAAASFTLFTYIAPYLTEVALLPSSSISPILFAFGVAGVGGLAVAATTADRWPVASLLAMTAVFAMALLALGLVPRSTVLVVGAMIAWGFAIGGLPAMLQARLLGVGSPELRATASAMMVVFFNGGIALGASLGGLFASGPGLAAAALTAGALAALAIAAVAASEAFNRPGRRVGSAGFLARIRSVQDVGSHAASWKTSASVKRRPDRIAETPCRTGAADHPRVDRTGRSRVVKTRP